MVNQVVFFVERQAIKMDIILLMCLLYALFIVNFLSKCCKKGSERSEKDRNKRKRRRRREKDGIAIKDDPLNTTHYLLQPKKPVNEPGMSTAHDAEDAHENHFTCHDYTPAIFNDLQQLFDLLKRP
ncbi:hypothetical protein DICVIV_00336 [Dictyocaulus viviparus]|uniref:Uncharacterized protein n=1 Tax=Dictyocaulus viviparus TaxID=29172 RepID=A0A0D8Y984_DICVI|nr:hypothetical protein DICVIV_00336 [Dictyocaulus viviparus]